MTVSTSSSLFRSRISSACSLTWVNSQFLSRAKKPVLDASVDFVEFNFPFAELFFRRRFYDRGCEDIGNALDEMGVVGCELAVLRRVFQHAPMGRQRSR